MLSIHPLSGALGAELHNVDLAQPLSDEMFQAIHAALLKYEVIFFRDQDISPATQRDFALRFGPIQAHPAYPHAEGVPEVTVLHHTHEKPSKLELWHIDMTFSSTPPLGSILHAKIIPEVGGDTLWSSMSAAYEGLSDRMQRFLSELSAVHDFSYGFKESLMEPGGRERLADAVAANPPREHPVVRVHPETGRKGLFVNQLFTTHIVGMRQKESDAMLNFLYEHAQRDEFTCRFRWRPNSIAFWDNRITQHKPINDCSSAERRMHRVTIDGDRPVGP